MIYLLAFVLLPLIVNGVPLCKVHPTSTQTASPADATSPANSANSSSSISSPILFPVAPQLSAWSTSPSIPGSLPLSDDTFRPFKLIKALTHNYTTAPDGVLSMQAHYPAGSFTFGNSPQGGFSFYAPGPENVNLTTAKEATFGYSVYFPAGFQFVKGGKLPGLCASFIPTDHSEAPGADCIFVSPPAHQSAATARTKP